MDNLKVQFNEQFNMPKGDGKLKKLFSGPRIIFVILGLVLLGEVIYAARVLVLPTPSPLPLNKVTTPIQNKIGKISLNTSKTVYKVNEVISVPVIIDTGSSEISGVDLLVKFDPKILEVSSGGLVAGEILDEYPLLSTDKTKGLISISGIVASNKVFKGVGQFAILNLKAKAPGTTSLVIDFKKDSTTLSNLVEASTSKNILESVDNLDLTVQ